MIGHCIFKNPKGPYDTPIVRMIQSVSNNVTFIGIINGPVEQSMCSITAFNMTNGENQTSLIGAVITNRDNNSAILGISDQITFSNIKNFKVGDRWTIHLIYKENDIIGQCIFTKRTTIIEIP